jgi:glycosyltransferase involved in cell wall biosynthesis
MTEARPSTNGEHPRPVWLFLLPWDLREPGGVNQVVRNLALRMQAAGMFEPVVIVSDWNAVRPVWDTVDGVATLRMRLRLPPRRWHQALRYAVWEARCRARFRALFRGRRIAAINPHFVGPLAMTLARIVASDNSLVPSILSFHGSDLAMLRDEGPDAVARWRRFVRDADAVVACSDYLARELAAAFGGVPVTVVHNGVDAAALVASAADARPRAGRVVVSVAKFEHKKGQDVLIEAFSLLAAERPDVSLVLAGAAADALPRIAALCKRPGLASRVELLVDAPHDAVARLLATATAFALPSRQEPFGIVLLEAGAFGLPVVATRVGGIPEIVTDGVSGRLVPPDDPAALAAALRDVLDDHASSRAMGAKLREAASDVFTWQAAYVAYARLVATTGYGRSR